MASKNVLSADNQQATRKNVSDEYLAGFTDGEGCFYVGFSKRDDLPLKWQVITEFHVSQNPGGKNLLEVFRQRLDCGYLKLNHPKSLKDKSWVLIVKNRRELTEKIIPFFKKNPLYTVKQQDFVIFTKVLDIIEQGKHLSKDGFKEIIELVFSSQKITNKRYSKEILISSASETIR
jgi:hypothetical protein